MLCLAIVVLMIATSRVSENASSDLKDDILRKGGSTLQAALSGSLPSAR